MEVYIERKDVGTKSEVRERRKKIKGHKTEGEGKREKRDVRGGGGINNDNHHTQGVEIFPH